MKLKWIFNLRGCRAVSCARGARVANARRQLVVSGRQNKPDLDARDFTSPRMYSNASRTISSDSIWQDDLCEIVYVDHFGNAMTGLRAAMLPPNAKLAAAGRVLERERTFSDRPPGEAFWYENSNGLAEIAVNQGRADRDLGLSIGIPVEIVS